LFILFSPGKQVVSLGNTSQHNLGNSTNNETSCNPYELAQDVESERNASSEIASPQFVDINPYAISSVLNENVIVSEDEKKQHEYTNSYDRLGH